MFGGGAPSRGPRKAEDTGAPLRCSLEDLYTGKTVKLAVSGAGRQLQLALLLARIVFIGWLHIPVSSGLVVASLPAPSFFPSISWHRLPMRSLRVVLLDYNAPAFFLSCLSLSDFQVQRTVYEKDATGSVMERSTGQRYSKRAEKVRDTVNGNPTLRAGGFSSVLPSRRLVSLPPFYLRIGRLHPIVRFHYLASSSYPLPCLCLQVILEVSIERGMKNGQAIRFEGKGDVMPGELKGPQTGS